MTTITFCPICASKNITQYHQSGFAPHVIFEIMPGVKIDAAVISRYFLCQNCHIIFQNPRMSDEELNKFYAEGYYRQTLNLTDKDKDDDERHRAEIDSEIIKQYIGKVTSHLDLGCSRGFLLEAVGATVKIGVESDIKNVSLKNVKVYPEIKKVPQKSFDLVTAVHTLEHVPDPINFLKDMIRKVSENGHLIIEVPSWKSPGGPLRLPHLFHFEPDVLRLMCKEVGLQVLETKFTPHLLLICKLG